MLDYNSVPSSQSGSGRNNRFELCTTTWTACYRNMHLTGQSFNYTSAVWHFHAVMTLKVTTSLILYISIWYWSKWSTASLRVSWVSSCQTSDTFTILTNLVLLRGTRIRFPPCLFLDWDDHTGNKLAILLPELKQSLPLLSRPPSSYVSPDMIWQLGQTCANQPRVIRLAYWRDSHRTPKWPWIRGGMESQSQHGQMDF